ncbi:MAG: molybdopterin synthase [Halodesulfurarchaeum sp.]|nr:molybdopterin synthase [Halodesulfurarchaeum sp.]
MQALGIVTGPAVEADRVLDPIFDRLAERGSVGIVKSGATVPDRTVYEVGAGGWTAQGTGLDAEGALYELAETHDYGLVVDVPELEVPQVAVGETGVEEPAVAVSDPDSIDVDAVLEAVEAGEPIETLQSLIAEVKASPKTEFSGAIATFTGQVRKKEGPEDEPTESLTFEKYEGLAAERMGEIERQLTDWDGVYEVAMHHRVGRIEGGENIVFVVVLAGHREQAFEAVEAGINRLKDEVPIFKKETTVEEEFWRHEREPGAQ